VTAEPYVRNPICLVRSREDGRGGGGSYCTGNVCFGMGARGTSELEKATCPACKRAYHEDERRKVIKERLRAAIAKRQEEDYDKPLKAYNPQEEEKP